MQTAIIPQTFVFKKSFAHQRLAIQRVAQHAEEYHFMLRFTIPQKQICLNPSRLVAPTNFNLHIRYLYCYDVSAKFKTSYCIYGN